jgi:hypothetical protein
MCKMANNDLQNHFDHDVDAFHDLNMIDEHHYKEHKIVRGQQNTILMQLFSTLQMYVFNLKKNLK